MVRILSSDRRKPPSDSTRGHSQKSLETDDWQSSTPVASAITNPAGSDNGIGEATPVKRRLTQRWAWGRRDRSDEQSRGSIGLQLLHASAQPLVDMIFVHGLRGGSIKTWRKGSEHHNFWPQFWLPLEPGFENVNIYTFGYDSDWTDFDPSILDVHAFGQNLLEQMRNYPYLRDNGVGHPFLVLHTYITHARHYLGPLICGALTLWILAPHRHGWPFHGWSCYQEGTQCSPQQATHPAYTASLV